MKCFSLSLLLVCFVFIFSGGSLTYAEPIWQVLMSEAVGEGEQGMTAVACVIRNRGGVYGFTKRKDLGAFCKRQGKYYISLAKTIERRVFKEGAPDITYGATHFESTDFPTPYWAKDMKVTTKIGKHIFYK